MSRDFTYIDDIIEGVSKVILKAVEFNEGETPYQIFNIGNSKPVSLMEFINTLEDAIGKKAIIEMYPMQPGDVKVTYADVTKLKEKYGYCPEKSLKRGLSNFIDWEKLN